jgi:transmembrane sensor
MSTPTDHPQRPITPTQAEEAGSWDARLRSPDCTEVDRVRFIQWRDADPGNKLAFELAQVIVGALCEQSGHAHIRGLRDEARRVTRTHRIRFWGGVLAASVILFAMGLALWTTLMRGHAAYSTPTGQLSTFALEDGSLVELDAQSAIKVDFSGTDRRIQLVRGQALFHVAADTRRPFIVHAADQTITAIGTAFDVSLESRSIRVTLLEGKVQVLRASAIPTQPVLLSPGQQLRDSILMDRGTREPGQPQVRPIDTDKVTAWRDGRIYFEDTALGEAVDQMNKHSTISIRLTDPALRRIRINGMFHTGEQAGFAAALSSYLPISVQQHTRGEIVLTPRP